MDIKDFRNEATLVATKYLLDGYGAYYNEKDLLKYNDKLFHVSEISGFYGVGNYTCFIHVTPPKNNDFYIKVNYDSEKEKYSIKEYILCNSENMDKAEYDKWINNASRKL